MPILTSALTTDTHTQADGSVWVYERHVDHTGKAHTVSYLAPAGFDTGTTLAMRAANIGAAIDAREAAAQQAANYEPPIDGVDFVKRITATEWFAFQQLAQTDAITAHLFAMFNKAQTFHRNNPDLVMGLGYLVSVGILAAERPTEILGA
jgi:hypothetical protein